MLAKKNLLFVFVALVLSAPRAWGETLSTPEYRLKIAPGAKITERVDTGFEKLMTVELDGVRARVRWKADDFTVIFPDGTLRMRLTNGGPSRYEMVTDFEGRRYKITRTPREVSWVLPGQEVFFRTFGGKVTTVVGTSDFLNITRDSKGGRISLESQAGTSDVLLRKGKLEVFDGPELLAHLYFVRGLCFHRGPITLEIPLPSEPFLNALPPDRYMLVEGKAVAQPAVPPDGTVPASPDSGSADPEGNPADPLRAEASTWDSPVYKANAGNPSEDPLNARREVRYPSKTDPLKASTAPDSEEILRVKDY